MFGAILRRIRPASAVAIPAIMLAGACTATPIPPLPQGGTGSTTGIVSGTTTSVDASLLEQLSLERINRARLRPGQEASSNGIAIDEGVPGRINSRPKPAVTVNAALNTAARRHARDMLNRNFFEHNTPEGITPFDRMRNAGYDFFRAAENLAGSGTTGPLIEVEFVENQHVDLFVDTGIEGRGHRVTMLNERYREVGIGIIRGSFTTQGTTFDSIMQAQEYGTLLPEYTFVLGVVFNDANNNNRYDFGEGVAGSTVTLDGVSKSTNAAGGYSFDVRDPGTYTIRFFSGRTQILTIDAGDPNMKVDLMDGNQVIVNLGLGPLQ